MSINRSLLPEMQPYTTEMTVLERQRCRQKWQQNQHMVEENCYGELGGVFSDLVKPDPDFENGWPESMLFGTCGYGNGPISSPSAVITTVSGRELEFSEKLSSRVSTENPKKRKIDKVHNNKETHVFGGEDDDQQEKKFKSSEETESKITGSSTTTTITKNRKGKSTENSKLSSGEKLDYIHVRARRGQATDSHSLAERVRREKISERMKYLQDLVPGCNKITGKAGMLDEIINYVQSLQLQVEFLSMKLVTINPKLEFNIDENSMFSKEFNPVHQRTGMDMNEHDLALRRSASAPVSLPETFFDTSCYNASPVWDGDLHNLYSDTFDHGRLFSYQPFTGHIEVNNLKTEM